MRKLKITVDILMLGLFLYLLSYHPGMGLLAHGICGMGFFTLVLLHNWLNRSFYKVLFKGKYPFRRKVLVTADVLLLLATLVLALSSYMLAGMVFPLAIFPFAPEWGRVHGVAAYWAFLPIAFHLGLHLQGVLGKLERRWHDTAFEYAGYFLEFLVLLLGLYCFFDSGIWARLGLPLGRGPHPALGAFYGEMAAILLGMTVLTHGFLVLTDR